MVRPIDADELLAFPYSESAGTDEQIADWIEKCGLSDDEEVIDRAKKLCWAVIEGFINVIKTAPTLTPPNEPLTIEQLREMDEEPVWVVPKGKCKHITPGWCILKKGVALVPGIDYWWWSIDDYNETWLAYRRPLEEEEVT